jgi:hypothetical protein
MSLQEILAEIPKLSEEEIQLLGKAIEQRSAKAPTVFELDGHLLDGVDDLPGDLRTNPNYMEDFGKCRSLIPDRSLPLSSDTILSRMDHAWTVDQMRSLPGPLLTCEPVITEVLSSSRPANFIFAFFASPAPPRQ